MPRFLTASTIYISLLSEAYAAAGRSRAHFLCVRDGDAKPPENVFAGSITIVPDGISLRQLFNRVQRVFVSISEWVLAMERSVARRGGLQELLTLSEPVLRNFVAVQDSAFKLIAYTKNIEPPGFFMRRLVQLGYHHPETMEFFRKHHRIEQFKTISDVIVSRDRITSDFDIVKKTFHLCGSIYIIAVMECSVKPANAAIVELFEILMEYIHFYAELDGEQTNGIGGVKTIILDILNKNVLSRQDVCIRSTYYGFPFEGGFRLYVLSFADEKNVPITHLVQLLERMCPDTVVLPRANEILIVEFQDADIAKTCEDIKLAVGHTDFKCGISDCIDCLWDLPTAYEQAVMALSVLSSRKSSRKDDWVERFRSFGEDLVYHIVSKSFIAAPGVFENSLLTYAVTALREYDRCHKTNLTTILRLFLENERSATAVAKIMYMHRNTILYHMHRVSNLLGVSLEDPETRLILLLAFKAEMPSN